MERTRSGRAQAVRRCEQSGVGSRAAERKQCGLEANSVRAAERKQCGLEANGVRAVGRNQCGSASRAGDVGGAVGRKQCQAVRCVKPSGERKQFGSGVWSQAQWGNASSAVWTRAEHAHAYVCVCMRTCVCVLAYVCGFYTRSIVFVCMVLHTFNRMRGRVPVSMRAIHSARY